MVNSANARIIRKILSLCKCQCLDKEGRVEGKGAAFEFFSIFLVKFLTLGTGKLFKSDNMRLRKPRFGAKFVVDKVVTKEVFKCHTHAVPPHLCLK